MAPKGKTERVRFLTSMVGPDESWAPGKEYDVPAEFAEKVADGVRAVRVVPEKAPKPRRATANLAGLETAEGGEL